MIRITKGFSLIELIVVMMLVGIVATMAVPRFVSFASDATDANNAALLSQMKIRAVETTKLMNEASVSSLSSTGYTSLQNAISYGIYKGMIVLLAVSGGNVNHNWNPILAIPYDPNDMAAINVAYTELLAGQNPAYDPSAVASEGQYQTDAQCLTLWPMVLGDYRGVLPETLSVGLNANDSSNCSAGICHYTAAVYQCQSNSHKVGCVYTQLNKNGTNTGVRFFLNWYSNEIAGYSNTSNDPTWTGGGELGCGS